MVAGAVVLKSPAMHDQPNECRTLVLATSVGSRSRLGDKVLKNGQDWSEAAEASIKGSCRLIGANLSIKSFSYVSFEKKRMSSY